MTDSDTPRTDAHCQEIGGDDGLCYAEFARELERRGNLWAAKCHKAWEDADEQTRQRMQADRHTAILDEPDAIEREFQKWLLRTFDASYCQYGVLDLRAAWMEGARSQLAKVTP